MQNTVPAKPLQKVLYTGPIEHLFFHPLIAYPQRAFKNDYQQNSMDDWFVTVAEFNNILQSLYHKHFIILAKKTPSSRNVKDHSLVSRWEMNWLRTRDGRKPF
ncbi:hypothetical protein [Bacillus toyonensis]|uniref:hypothetical protein n=1 Tax=Bacillus toyonensis TaxID=155322 RepID=UPI003D64982D